MQNSTNNRRNVSTAISSFFLTGIHNVACIQSQGSPSRKDKVSTWIFITTYEQQKEAGIIAFAEMLEVAALNIDL